MSTASLSETQIAASSSWLAPIASQGSRLRAPPIPRVENSSIAASGRSMKAPTARSTAQRRTIAREARPRRGAQRSHRDVRRCRSA